MLLFVPSYFFLQPDSDVEFAHASSSLVCLDLDEGNIYKASLVCWNYVHFFPDLDSVIL